MDKLGDKKRSGRPSKASKGKLIEGLPSELGHSPLRRKSQGDKHCGRDWHQRRDKVVARKYGGGGNTTKQLDRFARNGEMSVNLGEL